MQRPAIILVLCVALTACGGGGSPAAPTPIPSAMIQPVGSTSLARVNEYYDYQFTGSIQNVGAGCAGGTVVVLRLYDEAGRQIGHDYGMDVAGGLSNRIIRPQETLAVASAPIPEGWLYGLRSSQLFPTWNNVTCP